MLGDTNQSGNVLRDNAALAAGDINYVNLNPPPVDSRKIKRLLDQYKHEKSTNKQFCETVAKLSYYKEYAQHEIKRTLEEKLIAGKRQNQVKHALRMKDLFAQKLVEHELYESAQAADAYLLGEVCTRFHNSIYPEIAKGTSDTIVAALIESQVVTPVLKFLEDDDTLQHHREEVYGMIFFLTGNCHISWD